jgi:hypothetical protein
MVLRPPHEGLFLPALQRETQLLNNINLSNYFFSRRHLGFPICRSKFVFRHANTDPAGSKIGPGYEKLGINNVQRCNGTTGKVGIVHPLLPFWQSASMVPYNHSTEF